MNQSVIIHILKECNLACDLCYACSPKRLTSIQDNEVESLVKKEFLIEPKQLTKTIAEIPKKYDIFLRGGEVSLYPNWSSLFLSFAKEGHKINIDTNGQWVPKFEEEVDENFFEILKKIKHKNITTYLSCDKWHEEKDMHLKKRTKIFIKYAEKYGLNFFIFATGLKKEELKEYYKDLNIDFKKVRFNPNIYRLGRRKNDRNALKYLDRRENEVFVVDPKGDAYSDLQSCSKKNSILRLGNIKDYSANELIEKSLTKEAWKSIISAEDLDKHMIKTKQIQANTKILQNMINDFPISKMKILVPGCGTGQVFEHLDLTLFSGSQIIFTDINKKYLEKLNQRLKKFRKISYSVTMDDIENTKIKKHFNSCILILVLEHIEWKKVIKNILNFGVSSFYVIIQKQNKNKQTITSYRDMPKSITKFSTIARTHLIDNLEIKQYFKKEGFDLLKKYNEKVLDNKKMVGFYFSKK